MTTLDASPRTAHETVREVLDAGAVRSVFQPIVDLGTGAVVAFEALARGPEGPLESPGALFAAARADGLLAELDQACRASAFRAAVGTGLVAPLTIFVNVEPEVLDTAPVDELVAIAEQAPGRMRVVLEITERALAARPAELLQTVARVRDLGWGVALDDVGADTASLAFMPLLRPDVVKLDLSLVQRRPDAAIAEIMNAVNAHAEHTGALVLAEGIETEQHLVLARALGASLGQGWLFGRPTATPQQDRAHQQPLPSPSRPEWERHADGESPFACLAPGTAMRRAPKSLLVEISKQLEREAMRLGRTCVVTATFQHARHFTASSRLRYRDLVERTGFVCAIGEGLSSEPLPGVRGADLALDDPVVGEWDVVVVAPHFSAALLARDLGTDGPDLERMFEYAVTYERDTVVRASHALLTRVAPGRGLRPRTVQPPFPATVSAPPPAAAQRADGAEAGELPWDLALGVTTNGVTVADMTRPDQPLVFVNAAFERLSGYPADVLLGRNCRLLQGPDTDDAAVGRIRRAVAEGRTCRELLLNYRGPDREPWWNEVTLSPVRDPHGRVTQYIGVQNDVTAQVRAERSLVKQSDLSASYLAEIERLAFTDSLTGLMNRRRFGERVEAALAAATDSGDAVAVLFVDLDGFKAVNDAHGHGVGDDLLTVLAGRLADAVRRGDVLARLGGDEFLVALPGLDRGSARATAQGVADALAETCAAPVQVRGVELSVAASVGVAVYPEDARDLRGLLNRADERMYQVKNSRD